MPLTVKFSREFYDKFGHEAVDELVTYLNEIDSGYRGELKELNELNFARFDAKLEQRAAELEAKIDTRVGALEAKMDARVSALRGELESKLSKMETRLTTWMFVFVASGVFAVLGLG